MDEISLVKKTYMDGQDIQDKTARNYEINENRAKAVEADSKSRRHRGSNGVMDFGGESKTSNMDGQDIEHCAMTSFSDED